MRRWKLKNPDTGNYVVVTYTQLENAIKKKAADVWAMPKPFELWLCLVGGTNRLFVHLNGGVRHNVASIAVTKGDNIATVIEKFADIFEHKITPRAWFIFRHPRTETFVMTTNLLFKRWKGAGHLFDVTNITNSSISRFNQLRETDRAHVISGEKAVEITRLMSEVANMKARLEEAEKKLFYAERQAFENGRPVTAEELYQMLLDQEESER